MSSVTYAHDTIKKIWYREGTHDDKIVLSEQAAYRRRLAAPPGMSPMLMDLGANIGAVSALAVDHLGYGRVIAVEPDAGNLEVLHRNAVGRPITVVAGAVVAEGSPDAVTVYTAGESRGAFTTTTPQNTRSAKYTRSTAPSVTLRQLVDRYGSPSVVKCDIEGGEYAISDDLINLTAIAPKVQRVVMEVHLYPGIELKPLGRKLVSGMIAAGWFMPEQFMPRRLVMDPKSWWDDKKTTEALLVFERYR